MGSTKRKNWLRLFRKWGHAGGKASANHPERKEIAKLAAEKRWSKKKEKEAV